MGRAAQPYATIPAHHTITTSHHQADERSSGLRHASPRLSWLPYSLRSFSLAALVAVLSINILALELVYWKLRTMQNLDYSNKPAVHAIQYIPTVVAIIIGFAWKGLSSDLGLTTPWAAISGRWAKASDSILLNYADSLDIASFWQSLKHQHWTLCFVLACGFLSGAMVPLANSLTELDLFASVNETKLFAAADRFNFNGSLGVPAGWQSAQVWLNYLAVTTQAAKLPWLTDNYTYSAWNTTGYEEFLLEATVDSFSTSLNCTPISYNGTYFQAGQNSSLVLENQGDSNCSLPISQSVLWPSNSSTILLYSKNGTTGNFNVPPFTWLNITTCNAPDDYRILATSMVVDVPNNLTSPYHSNGTYNFYNSTNVWSSDKVNIRTSAFICSPSYWLTPASITINGTTGLIGTGPFLQSEEAVELPNVGVGLDVIQAEMNDPSDAVSQLVFDAAATNDWSTQVLPNSYNWTQFSQLQVMQRYAWIYLWYVSQYYPIGTPPVDPFFRNLISINNVTAWNVYNNQSMLKSYVENSFAQFLPTLVNVAARVPDNSPVHGHIIISVPRLFIRRQVLNALEVILGILALVTSSLLIFRPRTLLSRHPGTLQHISQLLANSPEADQFFEGMGSCGENVLRRRLKNISCRLIYSSNQEVQLELSRNYATKKSPDEASIELNNRASNLSQISKSSLLDSTEPTDIDLGASTRHRPLVLRIGSRIAILIAVAAIGIAAGIVLHYSRTRGGFPTLSTRISAWDLVPSIILVVLGYSIQSMEYAVLSLGTYSQLASNSIRSGRAMARRHVQDASRMLLENWVFDWTAISIPCFVLLLAFPVLKIASGKLFYQTIGSSELPATFPVNIDQVQRLNSLTQYLSSTVAGSYTSFVSQQLSFDNTISRPIYYYMDRIGSLNFPVIDYNITSLLQSGPQTSENDLLLARMVALNTSITCSASEAGDIGLVATSCNKSTGYTFRYECTSSRCTSQFGRAFSTINVTTTITPNMTTNTPLYFTETYPSTTDDSLVVLIADFSPLQQSGLNLSSISCNNKTLGTETLGKFMPTIRAINCTRNINLVNVNVTFARLATGGVSGTTPLFKGDVVMEFHEQKTIVLYSGHQQSAWSPLSYDPTSIELISPTIPKTTWPALVLLPDTGGAIYHVGSTLHPLINPYYTMSLIAQNQEIRSGNQFDLLNPENLMSATAEVYQNLTTLTLAITLGTLFDGRFDTYFPANVTASLAVPVLRNITDGGFTLFEPVMKQDIGFTVTLIVLLILTFLCVTFMSVLIPRSTLLPKAPNSIAAQLSILAGSRLVKSLRREEVDGGSNDLFRQESFGLGWWPTNDGDSNQLKRTGSEIGTTSGYRWGIDIGQLDQDDRKLRGRSKVLSFDHTVSIPAQSLTHRIPRKAVGSSRIGSTMSAGSYTPLPSFEAEEMNIRF